MTVLVFVDQFATYMGIPEDELDTERAQLLIDTATALVESIIAEPPPEAAAVVFSAVARAYSNPTGVTNEVVGPYQAQRPTAGVYLTKAERATLRRLSGGGGAFSYDLLPTDYPDSVFS